MAKKKKNDEFIEGKKFEFDGVWGADTPADWSDVIDDGKWETVPRNQPGYVDPKMLAEMQRIEIMMANAMALEAGKGTDGVGIVDVGLTGVYGAENMSAGDVFLPKKTDLVDMEEVAERKIPLNRIGSPEIIAENVLHILHQDFMTGSIIKVDGGENIV